MISGFTDPQWVKVTRLESPINAGTGLARVSISELIAAAPSWASRTITIQDRRGCEAGDENKDNYF